MVGPDCRSSGLSYTPQCWSKADARADLRVLSEVQIPWGWLPYCLLQLLLFQFLSDWGVGAQVSLSVSILRTLNTGRVLPERVVPRTVTLWPTCLANPSVGKPSASRSATGLKLRSSTMM